MWLHKFELLPAVVLAVITFLIAGWSGLVVGFFWSTVRSITPRSASTRSRMCTAEALRDG